MAGVEIERKFLVAELPEDIAEHPGERIEQGYLAIAPDGVEVRVRRRAGQATLTVKSGPGEVRMEEEMEIDERRFGALWRLTEGRRVSKTRHEIPLPNGAVAEVDVYDGDLDGLLTVEIEFGSLEASVQFAPPPWIGRELTGDARYANQSLALAGRPAS
ncbi:MAG: CYTH domain-containing protein [Solirubrobacteraceae bacterium]